MISPSSSASNGITVDDVFVPDHRVLADRPYGVVDPPLQIISSIAFSIVSANLEVTSPSLDDVFAHLTLTGTRP